MRLHALFATVLLPCLTGLAILSAPSQGLAAGAEQTTVAAAPADRGPAIRMAHLRYPLRG